MSAHAIDSHLSGGINHKVVAPKGLFMISSIVGWAMQSRQREDHKPALLAERG